MNAWPALQVMFIDGWIIRFSSGYTRRANSVSPLYQGRNLRVEEKIHECERLYFQGSLDTVFKMTNASEPKELDQILSDGGYQSQAETLVQLMDLDRLEQSIEPRGIALDSILSDEWLTAFCEMNNVSKINQEVAKEMLGNTIPQKCFASVTDENGKIIACGLAVVQRNYVGLFDIITHKEHRRQGVAKKLTCALLNWGKEQGAKKAYLQAATNNEPALDLYQSIGFVELYRYWYRVKTRVQESH